MSPFFSIVMTTHLRAALLRRSIKSILDQTFSDTEIIVVSDVFDRETAIATAELLRPQDVFVKRSGKLGPAESRNVGLSHAKGLWVVYLDDDDTFMPEHLAVLYEQIQANPETKVWFSDTSIIKEKRNAQGAETVEEGVYPVSEFDPKMIFAKNFIPNNALAFHHEAVAGCKVDSCLASLEDWEFLLAVSSRNMPRYYPNGGAVVHKDVTPGNSRGTQPTSFDMNVLKDYLYVYRRWPAPTQEVRVRRQQLIRDAGLDLPLEWYD